MKEGVPQFKRPTEAITDVLKNFMNVMNDPQINISYIAKNVGKFQTTVDRLIPTI